MVSGSQGSQHRLMLSGLVAYVKGNQTAMTCLQIVVHAYARFLCYWSWPSLLIDPDIDHSLVPWYHSYLTLGLIHLVSAALFLALTLGSVPDYSSLLLSELSHLDRSPDDDYCLYSWLHYCSNCVTATNQWLFCGPRPRNWTGKIHPFSLGARNREIS